jgi:hypothetical protein
VCADLEEESIEMQAAPTIQPPDHPTTSYNCWYINYCLIASYQFISD